MNRDQHLPQQNILGHFPLLLLPTELIRQVLTHLDSFSLRALLKASSAIASRCVVLHQKTGLRGNRAPCFFDDEVLSRMLLDDYSPSHGRRFLFKIYEVHLPGQRNLREALSAPFSMDLPFLSPRDSHVHCFVLELEGYNRIIYDPILYKQTLSQMAARCFRENGVSFQLDSPRDPQIYVARQEELSGHKIEEQRLMGPPERFNVPFGLDEVNRHLLCLTIEHCREIKDLFLPYLRSLTIVLPATKSISERPVIANLTMQDIRLFSLHYDEIPPVVENIRFHDHRRYDYKRPHLKYIMLCHRPSVKGNLSGALAALTPEIEALYDFTALVTHAPPLSAMVIGGPDVIITQLGLSRAPTYSLYWRQTMLQNKPLVEIPGSSHIRKFSFETLLPNATLPRLQTDTFPDTFVVVSHHGLFIPVQPSKMPVRSEGDRKMPSVVLHCYNQHNNPHQQTPATSQVPTLCTGAECEIRFLSLDGVVVDSEPTTRSRELMVYHEIRNEKRVK